MTQEGGNGKQAHYNFTALLIICIFNGCHMEQKSFQLKTGAITGFGFSRFRRHIQETFRLK